MEVFRMAHTAVKVFFRPNHNHLNEELQGWLKQTAGQITVIGITMDSNQHGHCLAVMYAAEGGPTYGGQVMFSRRHDGLEADTNRALAQAGHVTFEFVAVGSNEYGHCLCVIGRV
jgi:hypothetical protein